MKYIPREIFIMKLILLLCLKSVLTQIYTDNEFNQTIAYKSSTPKEQQQIEREFLYLFDLSKKPQTVKKGSTMIRSSASNFLINIYKNSLTDERIKRKNRELNEFNLKNIDYRMMKKSNTIISFSAYNPFNRKLESNSRGKRVWFDLTNIPSIETLFDVQVWFYLQGNNKHVNGTYNVSIQHVSRKRNGTRHKHTIDSIKVNTNHIGWIILNVTKSFQIWLDYYPRRNRGLFIGIRHNEQSRYLNPNEIGLVGVKGVPEKQPFMVGFFQGNLNRRTKRKKTRHSRTKRHEFQFYQTNKNFDSYLKPGRPDLCSKRNLYVNFKDLNWDQWIIAPEGFGAYYCDGVCEFPLSSHSNATNHAIIQSMVSLIKREAIPRPCCTPTSLSPMSVVYFIDESTVVLKKYLNMIVNWCGCI